MKINFVISGLGRTTFSAGQLIILEHAHELARRGHDVTLVPTLTSYDPEWYDIRVPVVAGPPRLAPRQWLEAGTSLVKYARRREQRGVLKHALTRLSEQVTSRAELPFQIAAMSYRLREVVPPADVTLATHFTTALPVWLVGTGRKAYFMQHHEVVFAAETSAPDLAEAYADLTYRLPLHRIANCSWLAKTIVDTYGGPVPHLALNAIDLNRYYPDGRRTGDGPFTVVSYSGRRAPWKQFHTAAEAMRIVREQIPDVRWLVYGGSGLLPPDNPIASYESVGFLQPDALRQLYSQSDVLLATSLYESFPLYPLEAMACGCAVVTTPLGTEDFAVDGENARVVPARQPERMAEAVIGLHRDPALRRRLAEQGQRDAQRFSWTASGDQMEATLSAIVEAPVHATLPLPSSAEASPVATLGRG